MNVQIIYTIQIKLKRPKTSQTNHLTKTKYNKYIEISG